MPARSVPRKHHVPAIVPRQDHHVLGTARPRHRRALIYQHRAHGRRHFAVRPLRTRHLPDRASQVVRIAEVHSRYSRDRPGHNLFRIHCHAHCQPHQNRQLRPRVEPADIFRGVSLGIALGLCFHQNRSVVRPTLHLAEDEVARPIQNPLDPLNAVTGQSLFQPRNHRNSAGHRRAVLQVPALRRCNLLKLDAVKRDQLLVRGHHALATLKRPAHPAARRVQATCQFHNHVRVRAQHRIGVFTPGHARRNPVRLLSRHPAIEDMGQLQTLRLRLHQDPRHRTPYRSKTKERNAQRLAHCSFESVRRSYDSFAQVSPLCFPAQILACGDQWPRLFVPHDCCVFATPVSVNSIPSVASEFITAFGTNFACLCHSTSLTKSTAPRKSNLLQMRQSALAHGTSCTLNSICGVALPFCSCSSSCSAPWPLPWETTTPVCRPVAAATARITAPWPA